VDLNSECNQWPEILKRGFSFSDLKTGRRIKSLFLPGRIPCTKRNFVELFLFILLAAVQILTWLKFSLNFGLQVQL
jgi:hypothetical protein